MARLFISGVTAFPLQSELHWLLSMLESLPLRQTAETIHLLPWIARVYHALSETNGQYPFLAYGTDWLAFAHLVLAVLFIGPYRDLATQTTTLISNCLSEVGLALASPRSLDESCEVVNFISLGSNGWADATSTSLPSNPVVSRQ